MIVPAHTVYAPKCAPITFTVRAHGAQPPHTYDGARLRFVWRVANGKAVTFDGVMFRNHTNAPISVRTKGCFA